MRPGTWQAEARHYLLALVFVAAALAVSLSGRGTLGIETPYFLFATAIVVSAYCGGLAVGLFTTLLSSAVTSYFILHPVRAFAVHDPEDALTLLLFTGEGVALSLLMTLLGSLQRKALRSLLARYGVALLAVLVALLVKSWLARHHHRDLPFVLFYTAVMVSVWFGGRGPGLLATALAAGVAAYFFYEPRFSFNVADVKNLTRLLAFALEGTLITLVGTAVFAARLRAEQLEEQTRQDQRRIVEQAALLDQARDAILVEDAAGRVSYWSRGAERMYGWPAAEAVGRPARELLGGEAPPPGEWSGELCQRTRGGDEVIVESRQTPVTNAAGQPAGCLILNSDVSERKRLEVQLLRQQRLESIGSLTSGIAHDLINILSPVGMGLGLLRTSLASPGDQALVDVLAASVDRGSSLVKQVVAFVRGDVQPTRLDVEALLAELQRFLRHAIPKVVNIQASVKPGLHDVRGDPSQLYQVLLNLCVNACDAMPGGGTLTLEAENVGGAEPRVRVRVRDTGTGIPEAIRARVFEPFFTTKPPGRGTGLGLSTTRALVEVMGGTVGLDSEVGRGTTFTIDLPAARPSASGVAHLTANPAAGRGELILIVEGEASIRELARRTLEAEGYRVVAARDAAEAAACLIDAGEEPRLVLVGGGLAEAGAAPGLEGATVLPERYTAGQLLQAIRDGLGARPG